MRISPLLLSSLLMPLLAVAPVHAGDTPARYRIHWYLGHTNLDFFEEAAAGFKKAVEERSGGAVAVDIVTADGNGGEASAETAEIAEKVSRGEAEMGHSFVDVMGTLDPRLYAFEAPGLFRGYRHMEGVIEGPVGRDLLAGLRAKHIVGLSFTYSGGANGVATTSRPLQGPEDLKGLKIGAHPDAVTGAWIAALGASPVAVGHNLAPIAAAARSGDLDGVVITWRNFQRSELAPQFKYFNMAGSSYLVSVTYVNEKFFDGLPAEYRSLIREESLKAGRIERAKTIELNETAKRELVLKGVRPVILAAQAQRRFAAALAPAGRRIEDVIGAGLARRIQETGDAPEQPSVPAALAGR